MLIAARQRPTFCASLSLACALASACFCNNVAEQEDQHVTARAQPPDTNSPTFFLAMALSCLLA